MVLVVADTSGCKMQATKEVISRETVTTMTVITSISEEKLLDMFVTEIIPHYGTLTVVFSPTTATMVVEQEFIGKPSPMTFIFTAGTT